MDWFRWHHGSVTDPKFALVARKAGASVPDVIAVWAYILETASQSVERGDFGVIDCEALDCVFGFPNTETRTADILRAMEGRDLTSGTRIVAWEKRQPKRERDDSTNADRQATFRAKQNQVTPDNASDDQKTPREDKSREDKKEEGRASPRGSRLPEDWSMSPQDRAYCLQTRPELNPSAVEQNFRDYWLALPGKDGLKLNWTRTWQKWVRNERAPKPGAFMAAGAVATVPGRQERDPELVKREQDSKNAAPMPAAVLELAQRLKGPLEKPQGAAA